jgi:hypothetical protein
MRSALFWDFMQHRIIVYWLRFGRTCRSLEDGTDTLSRNAGKELPFYAALNPKRAQILNEFAYQWNCVAWVKSAFGFVKQNWIPRASFIQNCHSFLFSDFHRDASSRGVTEFPDVWNRGQKIIKTKKIYICLRFEVITWMLLKIRPSLLGCDAVSYISRGFEG